MLGAFIRSWKQLQESLRDEDSNTVGMAGIVDEVPVIATATAVTLTVRQLMSGLILQDPAGGAVTTTTPTATAIRDAIKGAALGAGYEFVVRNTADAAETITVAGGTGVTISGTATITQNNSKRFIVRVTNMDTPSVTIYSLGTVVH